MKLEKLAVVIKADDGKIYQVSLSEKERSVIIRLISAFHEGDIKILKEEINTIDIKTL